MNKAKFDRTAIPRPCSGCKELTVNFSPKNLYYCRLCVTARNKKGHDRVQNIEELRLRRNALRCTKYALNPEKYRKYSKTKYYKNKEHYLNYGQQYRLERRLAILEMYGGACSCCGESIFEFLSIDHVNGGGSKHKKSFGSQNSYWNWLKAKKREGFRVLCHNCNQALGAYQYCPYQEVKS